jgi:hypothetical protein
MRGRLRGAQTQDRLRLQRGGAGVEHEFDERGERLCFFLPRGEARRAML